MRIQAVNVRNFNIEFRFRFDSTIHASMAQYGFAIYMYQLFVMPNHLSHMSHLPSPTSASSRLFMACMISTPQTPTQRSCLAEASRRVMGKPFYSLESRRWRPLLKCTEYRGQHRFYSCNVRHIHHHFDMLPSSCKYCNRFLLSRIVHSSAIINQHRLSIPASHQPSHANRDC
jgi:hypothetical protein